MSGAAEAGAAGGTDDAAGGTGIWQRVAQDLADDLAVDAIDRDRAGKPPYDEVARLRDSGLTAALVPPGARGAGTGWRDACDIVRRIAVADGSMGELLGRHYVLSWTARFLAEPGRAADLESRAAHEQWLLAGGTGPDGTDETRHPGDPGAGLTLTRTGDGYRLNGRRALPTAVDTADRLVLDAVRVSGGDALVVLVDPHHPGAGRTPVTDRLGQRLTGAGTVVFEDVPVGPSDVIGAAAHDEDAVAPSATLAPLALRLMLAQVVLGVAEGALAEARDLARAASHARPVNGTGLCPDLPPGADADVLFAFGELALAVHSASAVVDRATAAMARSLDAGPELDTERRADTAALVAAAETVTARSALHAGEGVLELADAEGLDRFWRNIRVLTGRGPAAPLLRSLGDHFLHGARASAAPWS
ncbi:hypothetical protein [Streptomyces sp. PsTaAH-124]|uniref:hypothetical protein n=1 Tax=Streptomyces sp. PsTaAH-124 TaxID=1157638 RepID=UPI0003810CC3|nr:hypothetical protein [Streptomyces sp. PsTaAH-124]